MLRTACRAASYLRTKGRDKNQDGRLMAKLHADRPRRIYRWLAVTVASWASLTLASAWVHSLAWSPRGDQAAASFILGERACKLLANCSQLLTFPGWVVMWLGFGLFESGPAAAAAGAIGWGCVMIAIWMCIVCRRVIRRRPSVRFTACGSTDVHLASTASNDVPVDVPPTDVSSRAARFDGRSRRAFLLDTAMISTATLAGGGVAYGALVGPWSIVVRRYRVPIRNLPTTLDGFRMVQISDTHLGPRIPSSFVQEVVRRAIEIKPDLYLLTGDYVHMGRTHIDPAAELFRPLVDAAANATGVVGVLGNHDHYADGPEMSRALRRTGVTMIDNDRVFVDSDSRRLSVNPAEGKGLCIAGLGDLLEDRIDPARALRRVPLGMPRIVLAHNPDTAEAPDVTGKPSQKFYPSKPTQPWWAIDTGSDTGGQGAARVDLMISGHTHGGQVRVPFFGTPGIPSRFRQKYAHGLVQGPVCPVLVSAGLGMSVLPVRVGVPPELVEITLISA